MSEDRTVHAVGRHGTEIVSYERSGKWYAESKGSKRRPILLEEAVRLSSQDGFQIFLGHPGGRLFDAAHGVLEAGEQYAGASVREVCGAGPNGRCDPPDDFEGERPHGCSPER